MIGLVNNAANITINNLVFNNFHGLTDSGTGGIAFWGGGIGTMSNLTVKNCTFTGVAEGINFNSGGLNCYVYSNTFLMPKGRDSGCSNGISVPKGSCKNNFRIKSGIATI
jgi:hypothetical protein